MKRAVIILLLAVYWYCPGVSQQYSDPEAAVDSFLYNLDLFDDDQPLDLTLKFDIKQFQKNKSDEDYLPAEFICQFNDTLKVGKHIRIRARGKFRRDYCKMPPILLNIKNADINNKYLADESKIKLVNHCKNTTEYTDYVLKEYLIYKMYNIISPYSFRVRLVRIKYIDTGRENKEYVNWAFLIEPEDLMVARLEAYPLKRDNFGLVHMETYNTDLMSLFQYLIGNSDYSISGRHNLKLIYFVDNMQQQLISIPYDFDYSGLVNAQYAVPGEELGIKSVTDRYYLGLCRDVEQYDAVIDYMVERKEEILDLFISCEYLSEKASSFAIAYLEEFYRMAESDRLKKYIRMTCR